MRPVSLLGIATVAVLAGLAFTGSLATALAVPARPSPAGSSIPSLQAPRATPEDIAVLETLCNNHIRLSPQLAVVQPEGAHPVHVPGRHGQTTRIDFLNGDGNELVLRARILRNEVSGKIDGIDIIDFIRGVPKAGIVTSIQPVYIESSENAVAYWVRTARGRMYVDLEDASRASHSGVVLIPGRSAFTLDNMQSWNGLNVPVMDNSGVISS
ncbi:hypothetical protein THASP1DRAFT_32771 [Thamnocephalis sphaerospora]|uniref:Uncharacterized protein n=1 Tax=Thamnocephalis sphaerospora TaxID=78915 RepID=A0A4V1IVV6_9FUNG|nr:hypothetical protein THASP1DRAFT_32771 [Thamnocephalis sphaerospora]|eukprot:RKP05389.1 hypothetical protein THASP1DRAFT_32771 [Thamnocephalis sphaerospora]